MNITKNLIKLKCQKFLTQQQQQTGWFWCLSRNFLWDQRPRPLQNGLIHHEPNKNIVFKLSNNLGWEVTLNFGYTGSVNNHITKINMHIKQNKKSKKIICTKVISSFFLVQNLF